MNTRIDLNIVDNPECSKKCSKEIREKITNDNLCNKITSVIDGCRVRCVGSWAQQKIYHLIQYFGAFTNAMKNKWSGINYIEICSGPGRCINRYSGEEFNGTSLAIIEHPALNFLKHAYFFDSNNEIINILNNRISKKNINIAKAYFGDYNKPKSICNILEKKIGKNHLNLIFIDPTDCSIPFDFIRQIKKTLMNVDFIINIASGTDFNRNIINAILYPKRYNNVLNKYIKFLDDDTFFTNNNVIYFARNNDNNELMKLFHEKYRQKLEGLGYIHFDLKQIKHYYNLIFATSNNLGIKLWNEANIIGYDGQREFNF